MSEAALPVGLIGLGKHGRRYLEHIQRDLAEEFHLVAISRRDVTAGTKLAAELGVRFHDDPLDLISSKDVRAVIAVAPPALNSAIVEEAVAEAKPLLIEKPFATTAADAFRMCDLAEAGGLPCLVAHTLRFSGVVKEARAWLPRIGPLRQIILGQSFEPSQLDWLDDPDVAGGGNVLHTGVHLFDLARHLCAGEATHVSCVLERVVTQRSEDSFVATLCLDSPSGPVLGSAAGLRATRSRYGAIRLLGEAGQIVADHVHGTLALLQGREVALSVDVPDVQTVREVLLEFARVARGEQEPSVGVTDGARAVAIAEACYRSAESGTRVAVPTGDE